VLLSRREEFLFSGVRGGTGKGGGDFSFFFSQGEERRCRDAGMSK